MGGGPGGGAALENRSRPRPDMGPRPRPVAARRPRASLGPRTETRISASAEPADPRGVFAAATGAATASAEPADPRGLFAAATGAATASAEPADPRGLFAVDTGAATARSGPPEDEEAEDCCGRALAAGCRGGTGPKPRPKSGASTSYQIQKTTMAAVTHPPAKTYNPPNRETALYMKDSQLPP
jgi:hypothetical protein